MVPVKRNAGQIHSAALNHMDEICSEKENSEVVICAADAADLVLACETKKGSQIDVMQRPQ